MQILSIINFAAAIQGLFLSYLLFNRRNDSGENRILGLLVLFISIGMLGAVLGLSGYYKVLPHLIRIGDPLVLLFGPLLFYYVNFLTKGHLPKLYWLHLIPFLLYLINTIPFYLLSGQEKIDFVDNVFLDKHNNSLVTIIQLIRACHIFIYVFLSLFLVKKYKRFLLDNFSDLQKLNLDKADFLLRMFIIFTVFRIIVYIISFFFYLNFVLTNNIISLMTSIIIYALAYSVWNRQQHVHIPEYSLKSVSQFDTVKTINSNNKGHDIEFNERKRNQYFLSKEQYEILSNKLEQQFEINKIYLESELSLKQLSDHLGAPSYQTSELINRKYKESFFDVINRHRIEEIKRRMEDKAYSHYSILGIAMDCGFNSKSSFNTAFRKFTGTTPSDFRNK